MAKKKNTQTVKLLSPEEYIRKRAKNLPVHECWVTSGWEEDDLVQILIARKHATGNITCCLYLVNLSCKGVKDSFFHYNLSESDYEDFLDDFCTNSIINKERIDYSLACNIVIAGVEYAAGLGIKPCKAYQQTTRFFLEEKSDETDLTDIKCDRYGKPFYMQGSDSKAEADFIMKHLTKTLGKDNFYYLLDDDVSNFDDDEIYGDLEELGDLNFEDYDLNDLVAQFKELHKIFDGDLNQTHKPSLVKLTITSDLLFERLIDNDVVEDLLDEWEVEREVEITNSLPGMDEDNKEYDEKAFTKVMKRVDKEPEYLNNLEAKWEQVPFFKYLQLKKIQEQYPEEARAKSDQALALLPDSPLIRLHKNELDLLEGIKTTMVTFEDIFDNATSVSDFEMVEYLRFKVLCALILKDINYMEALYAILPDIDLPEHDYIEMRSFILATRFAFLNEYYSSEKRAEE